MSEGKVPVAVITGDTSGLGAAICNHLVAFGWEVHGWSPEEGTPWAHDNYKHHKCDVRWMDDIASAIIDVATGIDGARDPEEFTLDLLINCAGINYLQPFETFMYDRWEELMDVNAKALAMTVRAALPFLSNPSNPRSAGTVINIVSNAAHVPMTHSLAYNASKAAALMVTRQMARELFKSHGITIFSISPNKLKGTKMSREIEEAVPALRGWTPEEAAAYQAAALPIGIETDPNAVADFIAFLVSRKERHIFLHGCDIPYGG